MSTIRLFSGRLVDLRRPDPKVLDPYEVARNLSQVNRFTGATRYPYSVAQHAWNVSWAAEKLGGDPWWGIHHDDTEAILGDVSTPLKRLLPEYEYLEEIWQQAVFERFDIVQGCKIVTRIDRDIRISEQAVVQNGFDDTAHVPGDYAPWDHSTAMTRWLQRYYELAQRRGFPC